MCNCSKIFRKTRRYLSYQIDEFEKTKEQIKSLEEYLYPGRYDVVRVGKTIAYNRNKSSQRFLKKMGREWSQSLPHLKLYYKQILACFLGKIVVDNSMKNGFKGDIIMFTQHNDIKIFDTINDKILYFPNNEKKFVQLRESYYRFSPYFPLTIMGVDDEKKSFKEQIIQSKDTSTWKKEDYINILECYLEKFYKYLVLSKKKEIMYLTLNKRWREKSFSKISNICLNKSYNTFLETKKWPYLYCHGDLHKKNILLTSDDCYYIDWEHSDKHIFFYDALHFMLLEARGGNFVLLDAYFKGVFDNILSEIFKLVGEKFSNDKKLTYLVITIFERLSKFHDFTDENIQNQFLDLLCMVENKYDSDIRKVG